MSEKFPPQPDQIEWRAPWEPITEESEQQEFAAELRRKISDQHILSGVEVKAVGMRTDCDDMFFVTDDSSKPLAVVHLTWRVETDPSWPRTTIYQSWEDWIRDCLMNEEL